MKILRIVEIGLKGQDIIGIILYIFQNFTDNMDFLMFFFLLNTSKCQRILLRIVLENLKVIFAIMDSYRESASI